MAKYRVHVFVVVRVPVEVEADSQTAAIAKAEMAYDWNQVFDNAGGLDTEYGDEISHFLVDEVGDTEYEHSTWYLDDGKTVMPNTGCAKCGRVETTKG